MENTFFKSIDELIPKVVKELDRIISDPETNDTVKMAAIKQKIRTAGGYGFKD